MITFLQGVLSESLPTQIVVDVGGVGYQVFIPLSSYDRLPVVGGAVKVLTHLQVREDAHILYGFMSVPERDLFRLLVNNVSGIGPKMALAVLSGMSVTTFKNAVSRATSLRYRKSAGWAKRRRNASYWSCATSWAWLRLGGGEQFARPHPRGDRRQRRGAGTDFARLQAGGCSQGGQAGLQGRW